MINVVLDAGHGGYDTGTQNKTRLEKNDNLRMARAVGDILRSKSINVIYTRTGDEYVTLRKRVDTANNANADLLLSFHRSASANPETNGIESYISPAAAVKSRSMTAGLHKAVADTNIFANRGLKEMDYYVVKNTRMPAMILNTGFMSNNGDNEKLDTNFSRLAQTIADAIVYNIPNGSLSLESTKAEGVKGVRERHTPLMGNTPLELNPPNGNGTSPQNALTEPAAVPAIPTTMPATKTRAALPTALPADTHRARVITVQNVLNDIYKQNLVVDGLAGTKTKTALGHALQMQTDSDKLTAPPTVRLGERGNMAFLIQAALVAQGYDIPADGVFSSDTKAALTDFQQKNAFPANGTADPKTIERLFY